MHSLASLRCSDRFDDVMQNCDSFGFSLKPKFISMNRFIVPNSVDLCSFRKIRCKLIGNMRTQICQYLQSIFREFATDFPETSQLN